MVVLSGLIISLILGSIPNGAGTLLFWQLIPASMKIFTLMLASLKTEQVIQAWFRCICSKNTEHFDG